MLNKSTTYSSFPFERALNIQEAQTRWTTTVNQQQLKVSKIDYPEIFNGFNTRLCYLMKDGWTVRGIGKGATPLEMDISASYEALERYFAGYAFYHYPILFERYSVIENNYTPLFYRCDEILFKQQLTSHTTIPWVIYEELDSGKKYAVPVAVADLSYHLARIPQDTFQYKKAHCYAASNGLAIGSSFEEAVIHGALEIIERDAYSYFLLNSFLRAQPVQFVRHDTLPQVLRELVHEIELHYQKTVIIVKMPSRFGVPVYLATFEERLFQIQPRGTGASLSHHYALERALYELIQSYHLLQGNYLTHKVPQKYLGNTTVQLFSQLDFSTCRKNNQFIDHIFETTKHANTCDHLGDYLQYIMQAIDREGCTLLVNSVYHDAEGLTCVRVIIPHTAEFFLVTHIGFSLPNQQTNLLRDGSN